ncbi:MAG: hypothetical protein M1337_00180 [Actinobacteria bacterium]|nr:hypothetical protein [Actinomycetota bacterium]
MLLVVLLVLPVGQGGERAVWLSDGICHLVAFSIGFGAREWWRRRMPSGREGLDDLREAGRS